MVGGESIGQSEVPSPEEGGGVTGIWFILVFTYTRIISDLCTIYEKQ